MPSLITGSCTYSRAFDPRFFRLHLTAYTLRFTTVTITISDYLLSDS